MTSLPALLLLLAVTLVPCQGHIFLDMSYIYDNSTVYVQFGQRAYELDVYFNGTYENRFWLQGDNFCTGNHVGTHMDAPAHIFQGGITAEQIPVKNFIAPAVVVDIRQAASQDPDSNVTLDDLMEWESKYGKIPDGSIIAMCSGWSEKYPDNTAVFGLDPASPGFHFPGFGLEAVQWLLGERNIVGLAVDTPSIDNGASFYIPVHKLLFSQNRYGLENVKDICKVPASGATMYAFPVKLGGASGGPVRVVASWHPKVDKPKPKPKPSAGVRIVGMGWMWFISMILLL